MPAMVANFVHHPGRHCGSTALMDVVRYYGYPLSEAMCFGIGSGLNFFYMQSPSLSPSHFFGGRSEALETVFFHHIGQPFQWHQGDEFPWAAMQNYLDRNVPILVLTDLYYLDYYRTHTHFGGHAIVLAGYDMEVEGGIAYVADTERLGLQPTSLASLARSMLSQAPPTPVRNYWHPVVGVRIKDTGGAVYQGLTRAVRLMVEPPAELMGLTALQRWAQELPHWPQVAADWVWCARFGYQVIEKRGTGGGAFRFLYAEFLQEAEAYCPELRALKSASKMREIAQRWQELAGILYRASQEKEAGLMESAGRVARDLAAAETDFWLEVKEIFHN